MPYCRFHSTIRVILFLIFCLFPQAMRGERPQNEIVQAPVTRDTWVSSFHDEQDANLGGATRLKTKGIQEFSLIDLSPQHLRGRVITGATLHLHYRSEASLKRVTVSTLATDWVEGTSTRYRSQAGSASFNWAAQNQKPWAWPGSDITAVMNGQGNTIWSFDDASPPDKDNWQSIVVDPAVVAARVAGLSYGFVVFDDVGNEYQRDGENMIRQPMRNRFFSSREAGIDDAPYFTVQLGPEDLSGPQAVTDIRSENRDFSAGEALISWITPKDEGPAGTVGFYVRIGNTKNFIWDSAAEVPRYLIPMAGQPGNRVSLHLRDLNLKIGRSVTIGVRAVDGAGNMGPVQTAEIKLADPRPELVLTDPPPLPKTGNADHLPKVNDLEVFIADSLDKVDPFTGELIPSHDQSYKSANHLWLAEKRRINLFAARNETVSFQLVIKGRTKDLKTAVTFNDAASPPPNPEVFVFHYVKTEDGQLLPDPLVPLNGPLQIPFPDKQLSRQTHASLIIDIRVPNAARPGPHMGTLTLTSGKASLAVDIALHVWKFSLPNTLSFIPQMNGYGRVPEAGHESDYYRLAQLHRTCLNILPYGWTGRIADDRAPKWDGKAFDWKVYDQRFGPLLDGSAFADLPRGAVPVEAFYLPLNENWPINIHEAFVGGYWIEDALKPAYRQNLVAAVQKFAEHIAAKGWKQTMFEFYLNNKITNKKEDWSGSSAPWNFDEPINTQDFWALRWYGQAFQEGVKDFRPATKLLFRADISRPQWQRNLLDGILDVNVVGGAYRRYQRLVTDRKSLTGQLVYNYGSVNQINQSNVQAVGWCIEAWCRGLDGVVPWQTLGKARSWKGADQNALFYPGNVIGQPGPLPSIRLKAFRRGQQDVEYLTMLAKIKGIGREDVRETVLQKLNLKAEFSQTHQDDAGEIDFDNLDPFALWKLRTTVACLLEEFSASKLQLCAPMQHQPSFAYTTAGSTNRISDPIAYQSK